MGKVRFDDRLMEEIARHISDRILDDFDSRPKTEDGYEPSEKFRKAAENVLNNSKRKNAATVRTIIIIAAVLTTLMVFAFGTSANRNALTRLSVGGNSKYLDIAYADYETDRAELPYVIEEKKQPSFIPDGFEKTGSTDIEVSFSVEFCNGDRYIIFRQHPMGVRIMLSSEEGSGQVSINGNIGVYACDNGSTYMVWDDGEYMYTLLSNLELKTVIDIAESVE